MPVTSVCPNRTELADVLAGRAAGSSDAVLRHLEECSSCSSLAEKLLLQDDLTKLIQSPSRVADVSDTPQVREVMRRLKSLVTTRSPEDTETPAFGLPTLKFGNESTHTVQEDETKRLTPAEAADELGRLGHYRVLKLLGCGGMGAVFLAEDTRLQRRVALKVLRDKRCLDDLHRERFLREARLAAAVRHENVVTVHDVDVVSGPRGEVPYLAMEFLDGESLEQALRRRGSLRLIEAVDVADKVASALAAAHERGMIHRDIKPANVFLEQPSSIKVLDFGLALPINLSGDGRLTDSGMLVGTPAYMSPEQANGRQLDTRTDLFSLGCLLYESVTGRRPFPGDTVAQQLAALLTVTPVSLREVMSEASSSASQSVISSLDELVMQLLQRDPQLRPNSANEVRGRLQAIRKQLEASASDSSSPASRNVSNYQRSNALPTANRSKNPSSLALLVGAVVVLLMGVIITIVRKDGSATKIDAENVKSVTITGLDDKADVTVTLKDKPVEPSNAGQFDSAWLERVSKLDGKSRIQETIVELKRRNPGIESGMETSIGEGGLNVLVILSSHLEDLFPLEAVPELRRLMVRGNRDSQPRGLRDISVLRKLKQLETLELEFCPFIQDMSPLNELTLKQLSLFKSPSPDMKWLAKQKLDVLNLGGRKEPIDLHAVKQSSVTDLALNGSSVSDLSPLQGLSLVVLHAGNTQVRDLSPLTGMPLKTLSVASTQATDFSALRNLPLEELTCNEHISLQTLDDLASLRKLRILNHRPAPDVLKEWRRKLADAGN